MPCSLSCTLGGRSNVRHMRELTILAIHPLATFAKLLRPRGRCITRLTVPLPPNVPEFQRLLLGLVATPGGSIAAA